MKRHGNEIYRFCRLSLRDSSLADDVHQQVFIGAYRDLHRFRGESSLRSWLFGIAHHRVLDAVKVEKRKRRREPTGLEQGGFPEVADPAPGADSRIDDGRLRQALAECLKGLSAPVREAVVLRHMHDFTFEQMAAMCGEKAGTLERRVARAMPALRKCIESRTGGAV